MAWTKTATQQKKEHMAWLNLWNATRDVRPLEGDRYVFRIAEETIKAKCIANYPFHTLFKDSRGWMFCLTPWEQRRYAV